MRYIRALILMCLVKPVVYLLLGLSIIGRERLPRTGPAIIAANHNSHLDTALLFALFPLRLLPRLRPVAAADYFLKGRVLRWIALNIIGILPIVRAGGESDPLADARAALTKGDVLFLFPEGSRGEPERMSALKSGIARLAEAFPDVPVVPVFLQGAGRSLPKGARIFVPFRCHAAVGDPMRWCGDKAVFMQRLQDSLDGLAAEVPPVRYAEDETEGDIS